MTGLSDVSAIKPFCYRSISHDGLLFFFVLKSGLTRPFFWIRPPRKCSSVQHHLFQLSRNHAPLSKNSAARTNHVEKNYIESSCSTRNACDKGDTQKETKNEEKKNAKSLNQQLMSAHIYRHSRFHFPHLLLANFVLARAEITFNSFASNYIHLLSGMEWKMEVNEKRTTRPHPARIVRTAHCEIEQ